MWLLRLLLVVVAAVLYSCGWAAGKVSLVTGWLWDAVCVGWEDARKRRMKVA